jgi:hypothetical protein
MDFASGRVPEEMGNKLVSGTESCIAVGCLSEHDGKTEIHLGPADHEVKPQDALVFNGEIFTPRKKLSICSVTNDELLSTEVAGTKTHVKVFANDPMQPDRIFILFGRGKRDCGGGKEDSVSYPGCDF